jgi:hypothetical protein
MKKEGQMLKKKPAAEGATLPLDTLYQRMEKFIVLEGKEVHTLHSCPPDSTTNEEDEMVGVVFREVSVLFTRPCTVVCRRQRT